MFGGMLKCSWAYRQTFCHVSWHVKQMAGALLLNIHIAKYMRYANRVRVSVGPPPLGR